MNGTGISEEVIKEIIALAEKYAIAKVILFGSRARGDYHRASDMYPMNNPPVLHFL